MPGGYSESSGLATVPDVTTYSPRLACVLAGRYWSSRAFGSPTLGWTMPVAPLVPIRADTPTELSVMRLTWAPSEAACVTLPTRPSSLITGSLGRTPAASPLSIVTVAYQMFGDFPTTVAATG